MAQITVTGREAATNADILATGRLITMPIGRMKIEVAASLNDSTNGFTASLTLPSGEAPWLDIQVPGTNPSLGGVIDDRQALIAVYDILESGHVTFSVTESGTALLDWRITSIT